MMLKNACPKKTFHVTMPAKTVQKTLMSAQMALTTVQLVKRALITLVLHQAVLPIERHFR